ncbi:MAG: S26 family signal peptidase [Sulfuricella sp.]
MRSCSKASALAGTEQFLKEVAGVPGDTVTVTDTGVTVNSVMLPNSRPRRHTRVECVNTAAGAARHVQAWERSILDVWELAAGGVV